MSKGNSHLFAGTSGEGRALIDEVIANGDKITPEDVVVITRDPSGKIVWLEIGSATAGLQHIVDNHGREFNGKGIANQDIPSYVLEAVYQGNVVGFQGKRNPRSVYEFVYNGAIHQIAVQVANNGFIVSANPRSMKEVQE